ncbi:hypothetical protein I4U23_023712 [Adineta vaga]|nr:hypothetical protein I4U23_023712 [Adineta vaga]
MSAERFQIFGGGDAQGFEEVLSQPTTTVTTENGIHDFISRVLSSVLYFSVREKKQHNRIEILSM